MRIAYIGLSYPTFYDYLHIVPKTKNDLTSSPNPIIESPWGLMILYDELWFLCESLCPYNMRNLSYVKFVDRLFPDLYYEGAKDYKVNFPEKVLSLASPSYETIMDVMHLPDGIRKGLDTHTHELRIGSIAVNGKDDAKNYVFDLYILEALKERTMYEITLISNSFHQQEMDGLSKDIDLIQQILISNIPNYLSSNGPYHECIEELRNHRYLSDFRKWIVENHDTIQVSETKEMCELVQNSIKETQERIFMRYLAENSNFNLFKSCSKTVILTGLGIPCPVVSIYSAGKGIISKMNERVSSQKLRWQGYITDAQKIVNKVQL